VKKKALERGKFEDLDKEKDLNDPLKEFKGDLQKFAIYKLAYYQCFKCKDAYFGGKKDCIQAQMESS
jgi:E3 ubiquitin-protein ligase MYCBP2